ncbi:MAG: GH25 family lysozyme [Candidatus Obscuribacterales bacterium]
MECCQSRHQNSHDPHLAQSVESGLGLQPMIYVSFAFAKDVLRTGSFRELSHYRLWIAHYTNAPQPLIPQPWTHWDFWQYTNSGKTPGVNGNVDHNRFFGVRDDLLLFTKPDLRSS